MLVSLFLHVDFVIYFKNLSTIGWMFQYSVSHFTKLPLTIDADERPSLSEFQILYFDTSHIHEPLFCFFSQISLAIIFTGSCNNVTIGNSTVNELLKLKRRYISVKYFLIFNLKVLGIYSNNMQSTVMIVFIIFQLYRLIIN